MKIGNSCGVIIPSQIMKTLSLSVKDTLKVREVNGKIILEKMSGTKTESPFDIFDKMCREKCFEEDPDRSALDYVSDIRAARNNKNIPQW